MFIIIINDWQKERILELQKMYSSGIQMILVLVQVVLKYRIESQGLYWVILIRFFNRDVRWYIGGGDGIRYGGNKEDIDNAICDSKFQ